MWKVRSYKTAPKITKYTRKGLRLVFAKISIVFNTIGVCMTKPSFNQRWKKLILQKL